MEKGENENRSRPFIKHTMRISYDATAIFKIALGIVAWSEL